jgi:hypothetical protein
MRNDLDIEDILKKHRHTPDSRVKQSVLARFAARYHHPATQGLRSLWQKPVPFYLAAAQIIVALGLGFAVARVIPFVDKSSTADGDRSVRIEAISPTENTVTAEEPEWEIAPNDLL